MYRYRRRRIFRRPRIFSKRSKHRFLLIVGICVMLLCVIGNRELAGDIGAGGGRAMLTGAYDATTVAAKVVGTGLVNVADYAANRQQQPQHDGEIRFLTWDD